MEIESLQIHLNSKSLSQGSINDAYFYINTVEVPSEYQLHLRVLSASIPYSFYCVNSANNILVIKIGSNLYTYVLNQGNYTITQFLAELKSKVSTFTITYDTIKSKLTFAYLANFSVSNLSTCLELIGFSDVTNIALLDSISNSITSINCINLQTNHCICVGTNFISNSITIKDQKKPTIICCIPINSPPNSMITYINPSNYKINIFSSMFSLINIKLLDQNGTLIDLNGCHWSMTLQLDVIKFTE